VPFDRWVRFARLIGQDGDFAQRAAIAAISMVERLLAPVLVQVATVAGLGRGVVLGALFSAVFALRGLLQSAHVSRTQAGIYVRAVGSVLGQDVLKPSVLPKEEARATLLEGAPRASMLLGQSLPNLCANLVAATIFVLVLVLTQPLRIVIVATLAATGGFLLLALSRGVINAARQAEWAAWSDLVDGVSDTFDGRLEIVAAGRDGERVTKFTKIVSSWREAAVRAARMSRLAGRLPVLALTVLVGAAVVLDGMVRGQPAARTLTEAALLASMSPAFIGIAHGMLEIAGSDQLVQRMLALVTVEPLPPPAGTESPGEVRSLELRDVHFAYQGEARRHPALRGVSLQWGKGELLALAGPNGSGKSTCLRLLLGLGRPSSGDVFVNGVPLQRLDLTRWRRMVAFLPQRPYLPPRATVRQCLRFLDDDLTDDVMMHAAERVGLAASLGRSPDSLLDARVDELSVGQRQRVGLTRLLCRQAPLVMLDEPDANLDAAGIQLVSGLVRELASSRMVIVVAHSPDLLAAADRVIALSEGLVSSG
jgi:ATP-binding cassette subfamily C protein CydD